MLNISVSFRFGTSPIEVDALQGTSEDVDMPSLPCVIFVFQLGRSSVELQFYFI
jgi:hypothetical protein